MHQLRPLRSASVVLACAVALTGCTTPTPDAPKVTSASAPSLRSAVLGAAVPDTSPAVDLRAHSATEAMPAGTLAGRLIVIDPGHNGVWTKKLGKLVPSGNGRKKACNSSGTATNSGYAEHAYNWAQANTLAEELRARGAEVLLTRSDDSSQGPCVNLRSTLANARGADVLISLHADGSYSKKARGFHVIISTTMVGGAALEAESKALAKDLRSALETGTAMPRSTYVGKGTALSPRSDIATLNLSKRVAVMMEMGNMRHPKDAALLKSAKFRTQAAVALADGIASYLG